MCNIVLSDDLSIRSYFEKVLNLSKLGDKFPVNLDDVWPLVYSAKEKAVRALVSSDQFMQGIDYEILATNGENTTVGRPVNVYMISISCMEYFIARKVRSVFNVYRDVFHKVINKIPSSYSLEDKKFFAKTGKRWLLSQRMIDSGYARYRYRNDDEFYGTNTVYVTPKGFQWIVSKISKEWMPRFLELKGRVLNRSDKDIFAKR